MVSWKGRPGAVDLTPRVTGSQRSNGTGQIGRPDVHYRSLSGCTRLRVCVHTSLPFVAFPPPPSLNTLPASWAPSETEHVDRMEARLWAVRLWPGPRAGRAALGPLTPLDQGSG